MSGLLKKKPSKLKKHLKLQNNLRCLENERVTSPPVKNKIRKMK